MLAIQTAVLDLIDACLKELKRANPAESSVPCLHAQDWFSPAQCSRTSF